MCLAEVPGTDLPSGSNARFLHQMADIRSLSRAVEDEKPEVAVKMYLDACTMLEEDGREQMAFDTYRAAVNLYIKLHRYFSTA